MSQITVTGAPSRYVQGKKCISEAGTHIAKLGNSAFCIGGKRGTACVHDSLVSSCAEAKVEVVFELFQGECCLSEIARLQANATAAKANVIVGMGGGKSIDAAKVVAANMKLPIVIIPTIAATDAPCSALSVIYTEEGVVSKYEFFPANPDLVLVDTQIICEAPSRLLVAGMGDALATFYEAEACCASRSKNCHGGMPSMTALCLAKLCRDTLFEYGLAAKHQCDRHVVGPALDHVVEANTLLSGLGFESGGIAAAHAVHNGLTVCHESHDYYHGEKVAFGVCTQLVLQDSTPEHIEKVQAFCCSVGLPITLGQLGIDSQSEEFLSTHLAAVAKGTCLPGETIHNMPFGITKELVADAILAADALGEAYLKAHQ